MRRITSLALVIFAASVSLARAEPSAPTNKAQPVDFLRDVKPILSNNCFACHGPDEKTRKGKLRLDLREEALKPARSGDPAIVPGKAGQSNFIKCIVSRDETDVMPPPSS